MTHETRGKPYHLINIAFDPGTKPTLDVLTGSVFAWHTEGEFWGDYEGPKTKILDFLIEEFDGQMPDDGYEYASEYDTAWMHEAAAFLMEQAGKIDAANAKGETK